jgi:hypothetical protein
MAGAVCDPADRGGAVDLRLPAKRSDEWHAPRNDGDAGRYAITSDVDDAYRCLDAEHAHSVPLDHAEACGYCVLLAHVPGLIFALVLLLSLMLRRQRAPVPARRGNAGMTFPGFIPKPARRRVRLLSPLHKK